MTRNPWKVWLLVWLTCGFYGVFWWYLTGKELSRFLERDEIDPTIDLIATLICGFYAFYLPFKYDRYFADVWESLGRTERKPRGTTYFLWLLLFSFHFPKMQSELNDMWALATQSAALSDQSAHQVDSGEHKNRLNELGDRISEDEAEPS